MSCAAGREGTRGVGPSRARQLHQAAPAGSGSARVLNTEIPRTHNRKTRLVTAHSRLGERGLAAAGAMGRWARLRSRPAPEYPPGRATTHCIASS